MTCSGHDLLNKMVVTMLHCLCYLARLANHPVEAVTQREWSVKAHMNTL